MIVLDTHIWVWWVHGDEQITSTQTEIIKANETEIIGVSAISTATTSAKEILKLMPCGFEMSPQRGAKKFKGLA